MSKGSGRRPQLVSREPGKGQESAGRGVLRAPPPTVPPKYAPDAWALYADEIMAMSQADGTP